MMINNSFDDAPATESPAATREGCDIAFCDVHVLETSAVPTPSGEGSSISTCNVRSLKHKLEIIASRSDVATGLQETDVDESNVNNLRKAATELGFTLCRAHYTQCQRW